MSKSCTEKLVSEKSQSELYVVYKNVNMSYVFFIPPHMQIFYFSLKPWPLKNNCSMDF